MKTGNTFALALAASASACALACFGGLAHEVRQGALAHSHELPASAMQWAAVHEAPPSLVNKGGELFLNSCAHCHGADAHGDEGPDLHGLQVSDRRIATVIARGIPGEMPSFAKKHGPSDTVALIAYLRTLN